MGGGGGSCRAPQGALVFDSSSSTHPSCPSCDLGMTSGPMGLVARGTPIRRHGTARRGFPVFPGERDAVRDQAADNIKIRFPGPSKNLRKHAPGLAAPRVRTVRAFL